MRQFVISLQLCQHIECQESWGKGCCINLEGCVKTIEVEQWPTNMLIHRPAELSINQAESSHGSGEQTHSVSENHFKEKMPHFKRKKCHISRGKKLKKIQKNTITKCLFIIFCISLTHSRACDSLKWPNCFSFICVECSKENSSISLLASMACFIIIDRALPWQCKNIGKIQPLKFSLGSVS